MIKLKLNNWEEWISGDKNLVQQFPPNITKAIRFHLLQSNCTGLQMIPVKVYGWRHTVLIILSKEKTSTSHIKSALKIVNIPCKIPNLQVSTVQNFHLGDALQKET